MSDTDIAAVAGPLLLGYLFNWGLIGALTVQVYMYYVSFPNDRRAAKTLVFGIYAFELAQTLISTHDVFDSFGSGWGNPAALDSPHLQWLGVPMMSGIISGTVQIFNAWRIFVLSKSMILSSVIVALAITETTAAIVQGSQLLRIGDFSKLQNHAFVSDAIWLGCSALCDVIISISLTYYLSRSNTGFWKTKVMLTRIIRLSVGAGSLTAAVALVDLTLFLVFRQNNYHTTPALVLAKLYSNSLLVQFNSRVRILGARDDFDSAMNSYHGAPVNIDLMSRDGGDAAGSGTMVTWRRRSNSWAGLAFGLRRKRHASGFGSPKVPTPLDGINISVATYRDSDQESIRLKVPDSAAYKSRSWDTIPKVTSPSMENRELDLQGSAV